MRIIAAAKLNQAPWMKLPHGERPIKPARVRVAGHGWARPAVADEPPLRGRARTWLDKPAMPPGVRGHVPLPPAV